MSQKSLLTMSIGSLDDMVSRFRRLQVWLRSEVDDLGSPAAWAGLNSANIRHYGPGRLQCSSASFSSRYTQMVGDVLYSA